MAKWKEPDFKTRLAQQAVSKNRTAKRNRYVVTLPEPEPDLSKGFFVYFRYLSSLSTIRSDEIKWLTREEVIVYKLQGYTVTSVEKYLDEN